MAATVPPQPTDSLRILSVDGGGFRGLIPALVIAEIERRIQKRWERTGASPTTSTCSPGRRPAG